MIVGSAVACAAEAPPAPALSATATVSDLFNDQHYQRFATTPLLTQLYERSIEDRVIVVGFVYSLGAARKEK